MLELYWPPKLNGNEFALPPDDSIDSNHDIDILKEKFPDGLSSHRARHALSAIDGTEEPPAKTGVELPLDGEFQGMVSLLFRSDSQDDGYKEFHYEPGSVLFETGIELVRQAEFEDQLSRFQAYFGGTTDHDEARSVLQHVEEEIATLDAV